jgi:hypothetical protein
MDFRELEVAINLELSLYSRFYSRKDQDSARYMSYLESEEWLEQKLVFTTIYPSFKYTLFPFSLSPAKRASPLAFDTCH